MKLVKMSLAAAVLLGASAFAIEISRLVVTLNFITVQMVLM